MDIERPSDPSIHAKMAQIAAEADECDSVISKDLVEPIIEADSCGNDRDDQTGGAASLDGGHGFTSGDHDRDAGRQRALGAQCGEMER